MHVTLDMVTTLSPILTVFFYATLLVCLCSAAWWVLRASARGQDQEGDRSDLDVYADQVREIDRDLAQGRIQESEADAARLEIGRRLVRARDRQFRQGPRASRLVLGLIASAVAVVSGGLYFLAGSPGRADMPFHARERELLSRDPASLSENEILVLLQERARTNPNDPQPHALMGQVLVTAGRDQEALRAFQAVLRRSPNDAEAIAEAAAILTRLNDGKMTPDAREAFDAALKLDPNSPSARFYLGLEDWNEGRKAQAIASWSSAYTALGNKPAAQTMLVARALEVMSQLDRGPGPDASMRPNAAMPTTNQAAFIQTMIASRARRLAQNPGDVPLRLSLVRVLLMTNQVEAARKALLDGVERANDDAFTLALYTLSARSLAAQVTVAQPVTKR